MDYIEMPDGSVAPATPLNLRRRKLFYGIQPTVDISPQASNIDDEITVLRQSEAFPERDQASILNELTRERDFFRAQSHFLREQLARPPILGRPLSTLLTLTYLVPDCLNSQISVMTVHSVMTPLSVDLLTTIRTRALRSP